MTFNNTTQATCSGVSYNGTTTSWAKYVDTVNVPAGTTVPLLLDSESVVYLRCMFGNTYNSFHVTALELARGSGDNYWIGIITSSYDQ